MPQDEILPEDYDEWRATMIANQGRFAGMEEQGLVSEGLDPDHAREMTRAKMWAVINECDARARSQGAQL
jgi:hypothetical protein